MLGYQRKYNASVVAAGLPHNTEASTYLDNEFQEFVTTSLEELLRKRPENPIFFLANKIKEKKKEATVKKLEEEKAALAAINKSRSRNRSNNNAVGTAEISGSGNTAQVSAVNVDEEEDKVRNKNSQVERTSDGYRLKLSESCECLISTVPSKPLQHVVGVPVGKVLFPTIYDLDSILRVMEASATPNRKTGVATPLVMIVEEAAAPQRIIVIKGIPYSFNLITNLSKSEHGNEGLTTPYSWELLQREAIQVLKISLCADVMFLDEAIRHLVEEKNAEGSNIRLCILPSVQTNYLRALDNIDETFFEIMHHGLMESMRQGSHYSQVLSARFVEYEEPPSVLFASYNLPSANLSFSRVIQPFFPYYERQQNMKMDELRNANLSKKKLLNIQFCENYWAEVHRRRDGRDKRHKAAAGKQTRVARREREDAKFLQVMKFHKNYYATEIQRVFRGYMVRKRVVSRTSTPSSTRWDTPLPLSVPPLLRLCASRITRVHGELFGNYSSSFLPQPKRVVLFKPVRRSIKEGDEDSEEEDWIEESVLIPPKRFSQEPCHFNPLQRLMEYQRIAECTHLESAIRIQRQYTGLSFLQRKSYDYLKSVALNLLHIAFLELFHRDRLSLETIQFSSFIKNFHGEVCGWFSYPHLCSQSVLLSACNDEKLLSHQSEGLQRILTTNFIRSAMRKERLLVLCSERDYLNIAGDNCREYLFLKKIAAKVFTISRILSVPEWKCALKLIGENMVLPSVPKQSRKELCWWFLSDSPCISAYGRVFAFRPRKNETPIEGLERYDEFCPREVLVSENSPNMSPDAFFTHEIKSVSNAVADNGTNKPQFGLEKMVSESEESNEINSLPICTICEKYTMLDAEKYLSKMITSEMLVNGHIDFYKQSSNSPSLEKKRFQLVELEAERFQEQRNLQMEAKQKKSFAAVKCKESDHESVVTNDSLPKCFAEMEDSSEDFQVGDTLSSEGYVDSGDSSVNACCASLEKYHHSILTINETAREIEASDDQLQLNLIRPRLNFSPQEEFIFRFDSFIESCLLQLKQEKVIVLNFGVTEHLFYYAALTFLSREFEVASAINSSGGAENLSTGAILPPQLDIDASFQDVQNSEFLSFLGGMYDTLREATAQNRVDVNECIKTVNSVFIKELEPYNLLRLMASEIEMAEKSVDSEKCRKHILSSVRYAEHYTWLVVLQVYMTLPFTRQSLSSYAINSAPSFVSFYRSLNISKWIDSIDPWINRVEQSPDIFHCRYTNSLRRWDVDEYICFGALTDPKIE